MAFYVGRYKNIEKVTYNIEVVTPMFIGGADPKSAELRVPPIKGMLRYWWRAINYSKVINNDFSTLFKDESKLFGDSDKFGRSKTIIEIISDKYGIISVNPLPHKNSNFRFNAVSPKHNFMVKLCAPKVVHNLFKFSSIVGGVGKRARRGFGAFNILNLQEYNDDISVFLLNLLESIVPGSYDISNRNILAKNFTNAEYPYLKKIIFGKKDKNVDNLLAEIGKSSHKNNSDGTGYAKKVGNKTYRLASPVYTSITKSSEEYCIIVSKLNLVSNIRVENDNSKEFINDLIDIKSEANRTNSRGK
ncbi:type III-B CRISPR module RAMP protein Cmr1 [Deferribacterales bacterium Es71-Z0220]|uniref:type III-B CRISPR module RAMP protein Cmr1 n=1 Tax=Deferrivibrio essentukiensis TaxID=2880922 RepID=UPI001F6235FB|nr:type III-B CRISPR module RAMP protein Cmr1 [Deferrivibrio essentukiensis]MCB4205238.1 type III-B CRISPR module RAMP protein Cmr1 [Deferrivibrio essentukiensis]